MSNLYEALSRGQSEFPDVQVDHLLDRSFTTAGSDAVGLQEPAPDAPDRHPAEPPIEEKSANDDIWRSVKTLPLRVAASSPLFPFDGSHWRGGEEYRILRTRILQHPLKPQMLVITSICPNDGKTVTVINLSGALALKSDARVLLIDGDFRRSSVSKALGLPATPGAAEVLKGECGIFDAIIQADQIPHLYVLPAGETQMNPAELLDSPNWAALCATCRTHFAHIVVDSPPMGPVADFDLLKAACDGIIVVARPDHTNRDLCLKSLQNCAADKMIGIVVNGLRGWLLDQSRSAYGSYYGKLERP
jgi:capsular exopolysaccharide synthesis family protein